MPRKIRIQFPGAIYHVMSRGDRREAIFEDDKDRELFLETLGQACQKSGLEIHAYCLMPNHFHLVLETPRGNLVQGLRWFLSTYTARFNRRHKYFGHLFSGRYKAVLISGSPGYLRTACHYVHLNPARARLLRTDEPLSAFRWSSYVAYVGSKRQRPAWLRTDRFLAELHLQADSSATRERLGEHMEGWRAEEDERAYQPLRRGWFAGLAQEKERLLELIQEAKTSAHYGEELRESDDQQAERLFRAELARRGWGEEDLRRRRKGDKTKVEIAQYLRANTSATIQWIAERLMMGTGGHLTHLLYWSKRQSQPKGPKRRRSVFGVRGSQKSKRLRTK